MSEGFQEGPKCDYTGMMCTTSCLAASGIRSELGHARSGRPDALSSSLRKYQCQHPDAKRARSEAEGFIDSQ